MVRFALFNELSLPFSSSLEIEQHFNNFLYLVRELKAKNIEKIRVDRAFKEFEVLEGIYFQHFFGQIRDRELKDRLRAFLTNRTIHIESPLIYKEEEEYEETLENEYFYNDTPTIGALASADILNTLAISFYSDKQWDRASIEIEKHNIEDKVQKITVRHASTIAHLESHQEFFETIEECIQLDITPLNFWNKKEKLFEKRIVLCDEVEKQIKNIDTLIFTQALSILRNIECGNRLLSDFTISGESQSVTNDPKLRRLREFTIDGKKEYFQNHIKNLSNGYRIHYFEKSSIIYIGYIGKHLAKKILKFLCDRKVKLLHNSGYNHLHHLLGDG